LPAVLANYRAYRESPDAWALGRLVIPVARLGELAQLQRGFAPLGRSLPLSVVMAAGAAAEVAAIEEFNRGAASHRARVECVETKATTESMTHAILTAIPAGWTRYVEVPLTGAGAGTLEALQAAGAFAKLRTGGLTQEAFPSPDVLLAFLERAAELRLAFKATAGLHHPLRGTFRLTYEHNPPHGVMHGYLNLLLAAAILWTGGGRTRAREALLEDDPASVRFQADALDWRGLRLERPTLAMLRSRFLHGIGSCSFREPLDELSGGGWR
jgi:hypothetical protein